MYNLEDYSPETIIKITKAVEWFTEIKSKYHREEKARQLLLAMQGKYRIWLYPEKERKDYPKLLDCSDSIDKLVIEDIANGIDSLFPEVKRLPLEKRDSIVDPGDRVWIGNIRIVIADFILFRDELERKRPSEKVNVKGLVLNEKSEPLNPRREMTLLKVIGALLSIKYQGDTYYKEGGAPKVTAIANRFDLDIANVNITNDGLKDKTMRTLIPEALEAIKENILPKNN